MSLQEKFISLMSNTEHDICNMFAKYILFKCTEKRENSVTYMFITDSRVTKFSLNFRSV